MHRYPNTLVEFKHTQYIFNTPQTKKEHKHLWFNYKKEQKKIRGKPASQAKSPHQHLMWGFMELAAAENTFSSICLKYEGSLQC